MQNIIITAADGYQLGALYATPPGESTGTVVISSATAVKKEFYLHFARFLVQNGYRVLLYDYRGVGESAPANLKASTSYMHDWGIKDMNAVLGFLVNEKKLTGIIWLGHSIGAQLTGFLENSHHVKKVIAINAALGYWGYFPFPKNIIVCLLWYIISPVLTKLYGYGTMKAVGWGENLPRNVLMEWRKWCMSKYYFRSFLMNYLNTDAFHQFTTPITSIYTSDDFIANDKTVPLMMQFFPNAPVEVIKINVKKHTAKKVGHMGIFSRKFNKDLWPLLVEVMERA
ncbi:alpha/beta hydrolase family protein [Foetidibacter luteolus]|uniref:alpha/beta hydrolase family protein n=1 Tax=Foetidibacter luteolus TaxID=2608880 RepID=UPI00129A9DB8|nr:alpha/beta fold hydrolase [Foetidibacter luteolus]